jgi:hypothetical protein
MTIDDKAMQIERDYGVPHPTKRLFRALKARDDSEVTPFERSVTWDRYSELQAASWKPEVEDGIIVLLMRGARIEAVAAAAGDTVTGIRQQVTLRLRQLDNLDDHVGEALKYLNLGSRA